MRLIVAAVVVLITTLLICYYNCYVVDSTVVQQTSTHLNESLISKRPNSCECRDDTKEYVHLIEQYYRTIGELNLVKTKLYLLERNFDIAVGYVAWLNETITKLSEELKRRIVLEEGLKWILDDVYVNSVGNQIYSKLNADSLDNYARVLYEWLSDFTYVDDQPSPMPILVCSKVVVTDGPQLPPPFNGSFCNVTLVYVDVNIKPPDWVVAHRQGNCRDLAAVAYVTLEYAARAAGLRNAVYFAAVWFNDTSIGHAAVFFYHDGLLIVVDPAGKYLTPDGGRPPLQELSAYNAHWGGRITRLTLYRVEEGRLRVVANGTVAEVATALSAVKN